MITSEISFKEIHTQILSEINMWCSMHNLLFWCINSQPGSSTPAVLLSSYISQNDFQRTRGKWAVLSCTVLHTVCVGGGNESSHKSNCRLFCWGKSMKRISAVACNAQFRLRKSHQRSCCTSHTTVNASMRTQATTGLRFQICVMALTAVSIQLCPSSVFSALCIHVDKMKHYQRCKFAYKICWACEHTLHELRCPAMQCTNDLMLTPAKEIGMNWRLNKDLEKTKQNKVLDL